MPILFYIAVPYYFNAFIQWKLLQRSIVENCATILGALEDNHIMTKTVAQDDMQHVA
jgi:hypothetical protein